MRSAQADVGSRNQVRMFLVRGSRSTRWGIDGYCWIPYDYLASPELTADFRFIQVDVAK